MVGGKNDGIERRNGRALRWGGDVEWCGEDLDMNFHIGYLGDCLSSIESDSVTLYFAGTGRPLVLRGVSDPSFTYLVMPLNR